MARATKKSSSLLLSVSAASLGLLASCAQNPPAPADMPVAHEDALHAKIKTIVVIYDENHGFDKLFGSFPNANTIPPTDKILPQLDRDGTVLSSLPQTWGGVTAPGEQTVITQAQSAHLPNAPFMIETAFTPSSGVTLSQAVVTRDLYHRFYENQMQIDGGKNDKFAAYGDAGGLVMGHYDGKQLAIYQIARKYTLLDNFYQGAFGGSFLNHQYLICACAPEWPNADKSPAHPPISVLDKDAQGNFTPNLTLARSSPASALSGPPVFVNSANLTPNNYFHDGTYHAVNTMQPPFQPSQNKPAASDPSKLYADPSNPTTLPPQTQVTIGDLLSAAQVDWTWYSGAWSSTLAAATTTHKFPPSREPGSAPNFQFHHQPFNFYASLDPTEHPAERAHHLRDFDDLVQDAAAGTLPPVVFYKPEGDLNEHPGYAALTAGDEHLAKLIATLQASPQWSNMVIVITYDENGGSWDHAAPPKADLLGPGTRIPAVVISPFAKMGSVDHTPFDTGSILRLITRRFDLPQLPGLAQRDAALKAHGEPPMGDLTSALTLSDN